MECVNLDVSACISHKFLFRVFRKKEERRKQSKVKINIMSFKTEHIFHINCMYATATNYISQTEAIT